MSAVAVDEQPVLVHFGLHKTASTWLQNQVLSNSEYGFASPWGTKSLLAKSQLVTVDPLDYDVNTAREAFTKALSPDGLPDGLLVISNEALSSRPHQGDYYAPWVAHRVKEVFPRARALLVVREQADQIRSLYSQHVHEGGRQKLIEFLGDGSEPDVWNPACRLSFFHYDRLAALYDSVFGPENVLILPMELLRAAPDQFKARLFAFCGLPEPDSLPSDSRNVSMSLSGVMLQRALNGIFRPNTLRPNDSGWYRACRKFCRRVDKRLPASMKARRKAQVVEMIASRVGDEYAASNRRLGERIDIDLAALGYDCGLAA